VGPQLHRLTLRYERLQAHVSTTNPRLLVIAIANTRCCIHS